MDRIGAGARCYIHDTAIEAAELCRYVIGFDSELLNVVENRKVRDLSRFGLQCGDAVVQVLVRSGTAAVDAREQGPGRKCDAGREGRELYEVTRVERHGKHGRACNIRLDAARARLQQGGIAFDGHGLSVLPYV